MILLAGVGYQHLTDLSLGPMLIERAQELGLRDDVQVEDLSFGPIAVVQWFQDHPGRFDRAIFAGAVQRSLPAGTMTIQRWESPAKDIAAVQERVGEAVTGVINLENTLIICDHFGVLPEDTTVIEFEPLSVEWGLEPSTVGRECLDRATEWVARHLSTGVWLHDTSSIKHND